MSALRAEFFFDDEAQNWHFRVPALHINGGGATTQAETQQQCLAAIEFALQGDPADFDRDAQAVTLDVRVVPAA